MSFSVHHLEGGGDDMMAMCPTGNINLWLLGSGDSARFLHCKVTVFLFNNYYFETMQISCFCLNFCPLVLASMYRSCYCYDFLFPSFLRLLIGILLWAEAVPSPPFIYLFIYISVDLQILFYSLYYNPKLLLLILLLKLLQSWPGKLFLIGICAHPCFLSTSLLCGTT